MSAHTALIRTSFDTAGGMSTSAMVNAQDMADDYDSDVSDMQVDDGNMVVASPSEVFCWIYLNPAQLNRRRDPKAETQKK
jgi:hypothetical protein